MACREVVRSPMVEAQCSVQLCFPVELKYENMVLLSVCQVVYVTIRPLLNQFMWLLGRLCLVRNGDSYALPVLKYFKVHAWPHIGDSLPLIYIFCRWKMFTWLDWWASSLKQRCYKSFVLSMDRYGCEIILLYYKMYTIYLR